MFSISRLEGIFSGGEPFSNSLNWDWPLSGLGQALGGDAAGKTDVSVAYQPEESGDGGKGQAMIKDAFSFIGEQVAGVVNSVSLTTIEADGDDTSLNQLNAMEGKLIGNLGDAVAISTGLTGASEVVADSAGASWGLNLGESVKLAGDGVNFSAAGNTINKLEVEGEVLILDLGLDYSSGLEVEIDEPEIGAAGMFEAGVTGENSFTYNESTDQWELNGGGGYGLGVDLDLDNDEVECDLSAIYKGDVDYSVTESGVEVGLQLGDKLTYVGEDLAASSASTVNAVITAEEDEYSAEISHNWLGEVSLPGESGADKLTVESDSVLVIDESGIDWQSVLSSTVELPDGSELSSSSSLQVDSEGADVSLTINDVELLDLGLTWNNGTESAFTDVTESLNWLSDGLTNWAPSDVFSSGRLHVDDDPVNALSGSHFA